MKPSHKVWMILLLATPIPAFAYVDPGSGHLVLQLLLALSVGGLFYLKKAMTFVSGLFKKKTSSPEPFTSEIRRAVGK